MNEFKPWYLSKGVLGGLTSLIAVTTGIAIDPSLLEQTSVLVTQVVAGVGALLSAFGRIVAKERIS